MIGFLFVFFISLSVILSIINGNTTVLAGAATTSAQDAVMLCISITGIICLWSGLMNVAKESGIFKILAKVLKPLCRFLFPNVPHDSMAMEAIIMNISSNLLGLGNAATPFGIKAMGELQKLHSKAHTASRDMIMLTVINSTSIQLIPTTIAALRYANNSSAPFDIMPAVWITSLVTFICGILLVKFFSAFSKS